MNLNKEINLIIKNDSNSNMVKSIDSLKMLLFNNVESIAIFGAELAIKGEYRRAIEYLELAIGLNFKASGCYFNRAYCYLELNEFDKALKDIHVCISLDPTWSKAFFKMGQIFARMKLYKQAELSYKKTLEMDPNCKETCSQITGNIYDALIDEGFDEIRAGYASEKFFSIDDARKGLLCGAFEVNLQRTRCLKRKKFKKLISKKGILIPSNFY